MSKIIKNALLIKIYCPKSGIILPFEVVRTSSGWQFHCSETPILSEKDAEKFLEYLRSHEGVSYPSNINAFFEGLWDDIACEGLHCEVIRERLEELGNWISDCSKQIPRW
jgi:hypothetical protein